MPSLSIAAGRLAIAAAILTPYALRRSGAEIRTLSGKEIRLGLLAGLFLALHFASWIHSLAYTSVASSTMLVTTNPLWVGIASYFIFRERLDRIAIMGIAITIAGSLLTGWSDHGSDKGSNPLLGDALALLGALLVSGYLMTGRSLRKKLSTTAYIWLAYTSAALILGVVWLFTSQPLLGFSSTAYLCLLGLALGPQLIGHTAFNWALKHLSATFISVAILCEPIITSTLAYFLFDESFRLVQLLGFGGLLTGILIVSIHESRQNTFESPPE